LRGDQYRPFVAGFCEPCRNPPDHPGCRCASGSSMRPPDQRHERYPSAVSTRRPHRGGPCAPRWTAHPRARRTTSIFMQAQAAADVEPFHLGGVVAAPKRGTISTDEVQPQSAQLQRAPHD
jgi:hypothetical protein